jgi:hypothetical protein
MLGGTLVRIVSPLALASCLLASPSLPAQPPAAPPRPPCAPNDSNFACTGTQTGPEDLEVLSNGKFVIASSMSGSGGLAAIRTSDRTVTKIYPAANAKQARDDKLYKDCPGPPNAQNFTTHGLWLFWGGGPVERLLAVGHGEREAIEMFNINLQGEVPQVTWVGCVIAPEPIGLNSVRGFQDGGFITTNFLPRGASADARTKMSNGEKNGELWEWHPHGKWEKVPGSEAAGANGVEVSKDGKTIYMAAWGSQSFVRLSRGDKKVNREEVPLGFRIDNIHWSDDESSLIAVGQGQGRWIAVKIDPMTLKVSEALNREDTAAFGAGTVAAEVGKTWWIGSYLGDRIEIVPAPP